jgi:hypothetical protein
MRTCRVCQQIKPLELFSKHKRYADGVDTECKACAVKRAKAWDQTETGQLSRKAAQQRNKDYVYGYLKQNQCVDCGESRWEVLEFDHVRGQKYCGISAMIQGRLSLNKIKIEIAKCDVRCANCHRLKTYRENGGLRGEGTRTV